jgi:hypothetical protein
LATASLLGCLANNPYNVRDGLFFADAVKAYPFFVFMFVSLAAGVYAGGLRSRYGLWALAVVGVYIVECDGLRYVEYWYRCILPTVWEPLY